MTTAPLPGSPSQPRILFIARSCDIAGMVAQFVERTDAYYCAAKGKPMDGSRGSGIPSPSSG
jgi:hypothetical protein